VERIRILIAEDEPIIALDIQNTLLGLGYEVPAIVATGEEALKKTEEIRPSLLLIDIVLTGEMDGIDAAKLIRERFDIPIIYLTAHSAGEAFQRARETDPHGYLIKPIGKNDLYTAIETAIHRHRLEAKQRESEEQYRTLVENINDVIFSLDNQGFITYVNPAIEQMSDYTIQDVIGMNFSELVHPDDLPGLIKSFTRTMEGQVEPYEFRVMDKNGSIRHVRTSSRTLTKAGEVVGITGVLADITERKKEEDAFQKRNREFALLNQACRAFSSSLELDEVLASVLEEMRRLLGAVACSIWLIDEETDELVCREATDPRSEIIRGWRLTHGQGIADWVVRHGESLIVPDARKDERHFKGVDEKTGIEVRSILSVPLFVETDVVGVIQAVDTEVNRFEVTDLVLLDSLAASAAIAIKNAWMFNELQREIEKRKQTEVALRESENRFRMVLDVTSDGVWDRNLITNESHFSDNWAKMLGYSPEEIEPYINSWKNLIHPEDEARVMATLKEHIEGKTEQYRAEFRLRTKTGDWKWVLSRGKVVEYDKKGTPLRILGTHIDISDRKQIEEALQKSELLYRTTINSLSDYIHVVDPELRFILFNTSYLEFFKKLNLETNAMDHTIFDVFTFLPDRVRDEYHQVFETGETLITEEETTIDGIDYITETRKIPVKTNEKVEKVITVVRDITKRKRADEQLRASLQEKEMLLKEIHHRVNNNFQIITSMLSLQENSIKDEESLKLLREPKNRIRSMALIHERLYRSKDLAGIDFAEYINIVTREIYQTYHCDPSRVTLHINAEKIMLGIERAIPCGLIVNELVSNAIKHAFPPKIKKGEISITLKEQNNTIHLTISDNGVGIPDSIDIQKVNSVGLKLVNRLTDTQLSGDIQLNRRNGTAFSITFHR
jgi:PAS domain S-box-containing protein